jgi:glyoxylase-like metal-dependent hydrolase (beta-lactamase superfamily II)
VAPTVCAAWERAGRLELLEGSAEPFPGVRVELTGGHTPGHQVVWLEGSDGTALLPGDLVPTTTHLRGEVYEGMDHAPATSATAKEALLARARQQGAWLAFYHAPRVRWGRVKSTAAGRYEIEETCTVGPASGQDDTGED